MYVSSLPHITYTDDLPLLSPHHRHRRRRHHHHYHHGGGNTTNTSSASSPAPSLPTIHEESNRSTDASPGGETALWRMNVMLGKVLGPVLATHVSPSLGHNAWRAAALRVAELGRVPGEG